MECGNLVDKNYWEYFRESIGSMQKSACGQLFCIQDGGEAIGKNIEPCQPWGHHALRVFSHRLASEHCCSLYQAILFDHVARVNWVLSTQQ